MKTDEKFREMRKGCTGKFPIKRPVVEGIFYNQCAGNFYAESYANLLDVHRMFRKGVLASSGGLLDQSSKYIEAMNLLEVLVSEKENEQLKKSMKHGRK